MHATAVNVFYADHHCWLTSWLRLRLGCSFTAADLSHDTFVKLLTTPDTEVLKEPRAYLTTIAHGLMVNHVRRRDFEAAYLELLASRPELHHPSPELLAMLMETLVFLDSMLKSLPAKIRKTFFMIQVEGMTHAEIAKKLNVSLSSVEKYAAIAMMHCLDFKEMIE